MPGIFSVRTKGPFFDAKEEFLLAKQKRLPLFETASFVYLFAILY